MELPLALASAPTVWLGQWVESMDVALETANASHHMPSRGFPGPTCTAPKSTMPEAFVPKVMATMTAPRTFKQRSKYS